MEINDRQLEAVLSLPGPKRYAHFIKVAADQRRVWGLFFNGWALAATDDGKRAFPLWPAEVYAQRCATEEWSQYVPREISLQTLFDLLIPRLRESGDVVAVFPTPPEQKGVTPSLELVEADLREELSRIE